MNLKNASLISLSIAGLLAGAPAMADTYTGCLTPGGTIAHVAPGDTPRVGICPKNHMEITLGGSGGFSDWTMVSDVFAGLITTAGEKTLEVKCPAGQAVLGGGGGSSVALGFSVTDSSLRMARDGR